MTPDRAHPAVGLGEGQIRCRDVSCRWRGWLHAGAHELWTFVEEDKPRAADAFVDDVAPLLLELDGVEIVQLVGVAIARLIHGVGIDAARVIIDGALAAWFPLPGEPPL